MPRFRRRCPLPRLAIMTLALPPPLNSMQSETLMPKIKTIQPEYPFMQQLIISQTPSNPPSALEIDSELPCVARA